MKNQNTSTLLPVVPIQLSRRLPHCQRHQDALSLPLTHSYYPLVIGKLKLASLHAPTKRTSLNPKQYLATRITGPHSPHSPRNGQCNIPPRLPVSTTHIETSITYLHTRNNPHPHQLGLSSTRSDSWCNEVESTSSPFRNTGT